MKKNILTSAVVLAISYLVMVKFNLTETYLLGDKYDNKLGSAIGSQAAPFYYLTLWYEIARTPNPVQAHCLTGSISSSYSASHSNSMNRSTYAMAHNCKSNKTGEFENFIYPTGNKTYTKKDIHNLLDQEFYFDIIYQQHKQGRTKDDPFDYIVIISGDYAWLQSTERFIPPAVFDKMTQALNDANIDTSWLIISPFQTAQKLY